MNMLIEAAAKRIVVIAEMEGYRRTRHLCEEQRSFFSRVVAVLTLHRPSGLKIAVIAPSLGEDAVFASHIANHFGAQLIECPSIMSCDCKTGVAEVCECLREFLTEPAIGLVSMVVPKESAHDITERLMARLRRPKKHLQRHELAATQPLYVL